MDPNRKRKIRLFAALSAAMLLATALIYTSFSAASPARTPSQLLHDAVSGRAYQLTGTVLAGSISRSGAELAFTVRDRAGAAAIPVAYTGTVPDPFREGREVIVTVRKQGGAFIGQRDSLITRCPSKFKAATKGSRAY